MPFLDAGKQQAFTPVLDSGGNMTVYTGDCRAGAGGAEIWTFAPGASGETGNGSWRQQDVLFDQASKHASAIGSNYLNGGVAFSAVVEGDSANTSVYFFGGMCPFKDSSQDWQGNADYSNLMVTLDPTLDGKESPSYQVGVSLTRGPPIPEAGFTLTGLVPSYSNRSDGTLTQQQNFVLVGGHTSAAFINMSQVALFALPQQGWTFIPVSQPDSQRTDLAIRSDIDQVEPRSGHTAVLAPDGKRLIVFGGWIGDLHTPAVPQLAILNIGEGYGGSGEWEWSVPSPSGKGIPDESGVYGHGAAMLPGGVMMVTGGYSIPSPKSRRRRDEATMNTKTLFFNVTSNAWITEYSPPKDISSAPKESGPLATNAQKAGLGVGIGVGMAAVLSLLVFYFWYTRRLKLQRDAREKQLQDLSMSAHRYNLDCLSPGVDGRGGHTDALDYFDDPNNAIFYPTVGNNLNRGWRNGSGQDAERTGLLVEIPSPTRGLRRSLGGRPTPQMARYDERRVTGSGHIHPIDELEEEQEQDLATDNTPLAAEPEVTQPEMAERKESVSIFDNAPVLDPFVERRTLSTRSEQKAPHFHTAPSSPQREIPPKGLTDWQLSLDALPPRRSSVRAHGRSSPDKSDRTGSNLSERSTRSNLSTVSNTSIVRTASMRSTAMVNNATHANPFKSPDTSPTSSKAHRRSGGSDGWESPDARTRSFTSIHSAKLPTMAEERDSFTTTRTSFIQLQAEGEVLLGGNPDYHRARPSTSNGLDSRTYQDTEPSMSRSGTLSAGATPGADGPAPARRKRWLGSVRKALARSTTAPDARTRSLTAATPGYEHYLDNPTSKSGRASPSPENFYKDSNSNSFNGRKSFPASAPPRRAASDAGFWRSKSKRGKQDWLDDEIDPNDPRSKWKRTAGDDWGAPEDLAHAENERRKRAWRERSSKLLINLSDDNDSDDPLALGLPTPRTPIHPSHLGDERQEGGEDEDWDVEAAVERRVVQVMFTVPKSRLRVVNADVERASLLSLKDASTNSTPSSKHSSGEKVPTLDDIDIDRDIDRDRDSIRNNVVGSSNNRTPGSPSRVKDLVGRFERTSSPERSSPSPHTSPSPSMASLKINQSSSPKLRPRRSSPKVRASPSPSPSVSSMKIRTKASSRELGPENGFPDLRSGVGLKPLDKGGMRLVSEDITDMEGGLNL